jgi:hypothetical protein
MLSVLLPPEGAGRIACRVIHSVLAFHHRAAVQGFPCRWQAFGPVCSPVAGRGNAVCCLLRWLLKSGPTQRWLRVTAMGVVNHRYIYTSIPMVNLFLLGVEYASAITGRIYSILGGVDG